MSFDRLAPIYRGMEFVLAGGKLQRCRLAWLNEIKDCRQVLIVGVGPGRFLTECVLTLPEGEILCVDASQGMLDEASGALQKIKHDPARIRFQKANLPEWQPPQKKFDLIVTHFFLDCFPSGQLQSVVARLASAAQPNARWLLSDFCVPESGWRRLRAQMILRLAYSFFRVVTRLPASRLAAPDSHLIAEGFHLKQRRSYDYGLLHSDLWRRGD